jgi:hypothetical protein
MGRGSGGDRGALPEHGHRWRVMQLADDAEFSPVYVINATCLAS